MADPTSELRACLQQWLGGEGAAACAAVGDLGSYDLSDEEAALISRAAAPRRASFIAGRKVAHGALACIGRPAASVLREPSGAPVWPAGIRGSIAHDDRVAIAAVTGAGRSIGLDIEPDATLPPDLFAIISTPEERHTISPEDALRLFSAKEAVYKAQYPLTRQMLDFADVTVRLTPFGFSAAITGTRLVAQGRQSCVGGHLLTLAELPVTLYAAASANLTQIPPTEPTWTVSHP